MSPARCLLVLAALSLALPAPALTSQAARDAVLARLWTANPPGQVLFAEDFEAGSLDRWKPGPTWRNVARPGGPGRCAQVVATEDRIQDLVLKQPLAITPGHPIAVCWRTRTVTGAEPLFLRVDFFGADGKQGQPYARQEQVRTGPNWTENTLLVSDWFPPYTRAMTIWFHQAQRSGTTALLDDIRVVDLAPAIEALLQAEIPALRTEADQLAAALAKLPASPVNDAWRTTATQRLPAIRAQLDAAARLAPGSDGAAQALAEPGVYVRRLNQAVAALTERRLATSGLLTYVTRPISSTMILPYSAELPGQLAAKVELAACPGEFEPASLALWAPDGVPDLAVTAGNLRGAGGTIPATSLDLKWVKCWYQGGNAPQGISVVRDQKALVPELLLNDDELVRVDLAGQHNSLKLSFADGPRYVPIDDPKVVPWGSKLSLTEFPVKDSPTFRPANLPAGQNKQLWLTVHVPADARAGVYQGSLRFAAAGRPLGEVTVALTVLPFTLPAPKTHYDAGADFTFSLYYWGYLDPNGRGSISYHHKSEQQFRAELTYLRDRGVVAPCFIWPARLVYDDEPGFRRHLQIAKEVGFTGQPLVFGSSDLIGAPTAPAALEQLQTRVRRTIAIAREYGFTDVYFYGIDEATGDTLKSERIAWQAVHEAGGKVIVSGFHGQLEAVGDLLDLFNRAGDPRAERPAEWHRRGHKLWNYANPQTPVEDPLVYRRNFGLYLWQADFDGVNTYCFMDSEGLTWNDFDGPHYRDHTVAYPTVDGVVATLAMEGFREAADDLKYLTALRQAMARAERDGTVAQQAAARQAQTWLEGLDAKTADLDAMRREAIQRIISLAR